MCTAERASSSTTRWADIVDDGDEDEHEDDFVWTETEPDEEPEGDEH